MGEEKREEIARWTRKSFVCFLCCYSLLLDVGAQSSVDKSICEPPHVDKAGVHARTTFNPSIDPTLPTGRVKIPVVIHVFHVGDSGRISREQAISGLQVINEDFNGENPDFHDIPLQFDSIKAVMNIEFFLATVDPEGLPTDGIVYHEDEEAAFNEGFKIYQYAWDNFKYLNIYLPIYSYSVPSIRTAYASLPSLSGSENGRDGIVHSSVRWGYGDKSELSPDSELLSIATHEVGHWLNLRHPFSVTCSGVGDLVDDTPPTLGDSISFTGCNNFDFSCGVATNGSNYMDYNHGCKKMFTRGQVARMYEALVHPSRINHWSVENLIATGGIDLPTNEHVRFFSDSNGELTLIADQSIASVELFDMQGRSLVLASPNTSVMHFDGFERKGLLLYEIVFANQTSEKGKIFYN